MRAPARRTRRAVSKSWCSLSIVHGRAMTTTSSLPIRTPRALTTVFSGRNVRLESLYGSLTRTTSWTPSISSNSRGSISSTFPTTPSTVCSEPVERCTSKPRAVSSAMTCSMFPSVVCFCITMTMSSPIWRAVGRRTASGTRAAADHPRGFDLPFVGCGFALYAPGLVDDSLEEPAHGDAVERTLGRSLGTPKHLLFALRRVDRQAEDGLHFSDLDGVLRSLVEEADDDLIDPVDGIPQPLHP